MSRKRFKVAGLIYQDELEGLKNYINILDLKYIESRMFDNEKIKAYQITILKKDVEKLKKIMTCQNYNVRKR